MDNKYICYCGLYCENCATKAKVEPAAKVLHDEMKIAGFEDIIHFLPNGVEFWTFLKSVAEDGACISCKEGSGNPGCAVRICAKEKGLELCALCDSYPCDKFTDFFEGYPMLKHDNTFIREQGMEAWVKLQDERKASGFTYSDAKASM